MNPQWYQNVTKAMFLVVGFGEHGYVACLRHCKTLEDAQRVANDYRSDTRFHAVKVAEPGKKVFSE